MSGNQQEPYNYDPAEARESSGNGATSHDSDRLETHDDEPVNFPALSSDFAPSYDPVYITAPAEDLRPSFRQFPSVGTILDPRRPLQSRPPQRRGIQSSVRTDQQDLRAMPEGEIHDPLGFDLLAPQIGARQDRLAATSPEQEGSQAAYEEVTQRNGDDGLDDMYVYHAESDEWVTPEEFQRREDLRRAAGRAARRRRTPGISRAQLWDDDHPRPYPANHPSRATSSEAGADTNGGGHVQNGNGGRSPP